MAVGWIDNVYVKTSRPWYFQSVDDRYQGTLEDGPRQIDLYDGRMHKILPGRYDAWECGIPSYNHGQHYKAITKEQRIRIPLGIRFYTLEMGVDNWIIYEESLSGRQIARQRAPKGSDFHCTLRFEYNGPYLDIVNNPQFSGENAVFQIYNESQRWVEVGQEEMADQLGVRCF